MFRPIWSFIIRAFCLWWVGWLSLGFIWLVGGIAGGLLGGVPMAIATDVLLFALWGYWQSARVAARRRLAREVLSGLHDAVLLSLPLPAALSAMASSESEHGRLRLRLADLSTACAAGVPLAEAIATAVPEVEAREKAMIQAAGRSGRLGPMLGYLTRQPALPVYPGVRAALQVTPLILILLMMLGVAILIAPKYLEIARDFGMDPSSFSAKSNIISSCPPFIAKWVGIKKGLAHWGVTSVVTSVLLPAFFMLPMLLSWWGRNGLLEWRRLGCVIAWYLPVVGRSVRDTAQADAALLAAESLRSGSDLPAALLLAAEAVTWPLARQLRYAALQLASGACISDVIARLPPTLRRALSSAGAGADAVESLELAHRMAHARAEMGRHMLMQAISVAMVLMAGGMAGIYAWAFIGIEVDILHHLVHWTDPVGGPL